MKVIFRPITSSLNDILDNTLMKSTWQEYGESYIKALEEVTGLKFKHSVINIRCGKADHSHSGTIGKEAIQIAVTGFSWINKKSGSADRKPDIELLETLTHELAHRLLAEHKILLPNSTPRENYETHKYIYVFIYDAWLEAFGKIKAKQLADVVSQNDMPDYKDAWRWAMKLNAKRRTELTKSLRPGKLLPEKVSKYLN